MAAIYELSNHGSLRIPFTTFRLRLITQSSRLFGQDLENPPLQQRPTSASVQASRALSALVGAKQQTSAAEATPTSPLKKPTAPFR